MADGQVGNVLGVTAVGPAGQGAKNAYSNINGGADAATGFDLVPLAATDTISAMKTYLTSVSATTFSPARLNSMTYNDLLYAVRMQGAPGSVKSSK
jgi:hypothetical protein